MRGQKVVVKEEKKYSTSFSAKALIDTIDTYKDVEESLPSQTQSETDELPSGSLLNDILNMVIEGEKLKKLNDTRAFRSSARTGTPLIPS